MKKISVLWWPVALLLALTTCIPIKDRVDPDILPPQGLLDTYWFQDTLKLRTTFVDNEGLDSCFVTLRRQGSGGSGATFFFRRKFVIRSRRFDLRFDTLIPNFVVRGTYSLSIDVIDRGQNLRNFSRTIELRGDRKPPILRNVTLDFPTYSDPNVADYIACRSQVIRVRTGTASDSLFLSRMEVLINDNLRASENVALPANVPLDLPRFFGTRFSIPQDVPDGTIYTFEIVAKDLEFSEPPQEGPNVARQRFRILVSCDDRPPVISIIQSTPQISAQQVVTVPEGGQFVLQRVNFSDNVGLQQLQMSLTRILPSILPIATIDRPASPANALTDSLSNRVVPLPANAAVGQEYDLRLDARDVTGNFATPVIVRIKIVEDNPPLLIVTNNYLNTNSALFSENTASPLLVNRGDRITLDGRAEDDRQISTLRYVWQNTTTGNAVIPDIVASPNSVAANLASYFGPNTFTVPVTAPAGTRLELRITATDNRSNPGPQSTTKVYYFQVQ